MAYEPDLDPPEIGADPELDAAIRASKQSSSIGSGPPKMKKAKTTADPATVQFIME